MSSEQQAAIEHAQRMTALSLGQFFQTSDELTQVHLDDITEMANEVARVLPAGNVVKMVFAQLRSIKGRRIPTDDTRRMMSLLHQGMATFLDKATYMTFYTTPAILISGYQLLLKASGRDPQSAFPYGTWQFYLEFGLREDAARHVSETVGFHQTIEQEGLTVTEADQLAAWIMATHDLLMTYDRLLSLEWNERLLLKRLGQQLHNPKMIAHWVARRPYGVPQEDERDYLAYRSEIFGNFVREMLSTKMRDTAVDETIQFWTKEETLTQEDRRHYQEQMSLRAMLDPNAFDDIRVPIGLADIRIAVVWRGEYHIIPVMHKGVPLELPIIRAMANEILNTTPPAKRSELDELLIQIPRAAQRTARMQLPKSSIEQLELLRTAPIIINWERSASGLPLAQIRQGRRGIGDHALTLFRTNNSMVFDKSHIFFDAIWGMAIAEIMTNQAIHYVRQMDRVQPMRSALMRPTVINLVVHPKVSNALSKHVAPVPEISAEVELPLVVEINKLRGLLSQRNDELNLTVNDFLVLYRSIYNQFYRPSTQLVRELNVLNKAGVRQAKAVQDIFEMFEDIRHTSPAFLIPIDASVVNPTARIFPVTFCPTPPWTDIGPKHNAVWDLLGRYREAHSDEMWKAFSDERTYYLEMLRMFGVLMQRYKDIALEGKSLSTATLEILGGIPKRLQALLSNIPDRIDILNDMLKGTEVFSNVGKVANTSSLSRFTTAKDDNQKKELCWGVMTRADDTMVITLRDFRSQVTALLKVDAPEIGQMVTRDFLDGYAQGFHSYIVELTEIVQIRKKRKK